MKYLVTGGAGFIGSHLCARLLAEGHDVTVLDNLSSGTRERLPAGVHFLHGDIRDAAMVTKALAGAEGCFHLAAIASVEVARRDWRTAHAVNLGGTLEVFAACQASGTPVVYASSAAVYGNGLPMPLSEAMTPHPQTLYGVDKLACELHASTHRAPSLGLRFFNIYGPGQDASSPYAGVIARFIDALAQGKELTLYGDGRQTRDFIYVADAVDALLLGMQALHKGDSLPPALNVCTGQSCDIASLAKLLSETMNTRMIVAHQSERTGDIRHSRGNPSRIHYYLHWSPRHTLAQGLALSVT